MKRILTIAILSLVAFASISAQKFSVAYVDMQYILKNLPQYETANEQLNMISRRWQKDIASISDKMASGTKSANHSSNLYKTRSTMLSRISLPRRATISSRTDLPNLVSSICLANWTSPTRFCKNSEPNSPPSPTSPTRINN